MANKFGLGRGLADLKNEMGSTPDISILTGVARVAVKNIPLAQIGANPDQPRKTFDEQELKELAESIRVRGVLQPILLRAVTGRPYLYEIVAGERRYRASKLAGLNEIPALVKTLDNASTMEVALIENVQRENLNPIEEAAAYKNLMEKCGYEIADVCRLIGKSESYVRNMMRIDSLPASVKEMVASGKISASHARSIIVAPDPEKLAHEIIAGNLSVSDTAARVKAGPRATSARRTRDTSIDADTRRSLESRISDALDAHATISERRGGAGRIIIDFATRVQLMEIIEKISK